MLLRIVPEGGPGGAGPVIIADGAFVGGDSCLLTHRETNAESVAGPRQICRWSLADLAQMIRGHERDRCGAQDAVAVEGATILQHLQELRVIEGSGNHALTARFPFRGEPWVTERRGAYHLVVGRQRLRDQILLCRGNRKGGVAHIERIKNVLLLE